MLNNLEFMVGIVVLIIIVGFIYNRYFNDGGWDE